MRQAGSLQRPLVLDDQLVAMLAERRDALDELGDALEQHQHEAERQKELDRPEQEAAGVRGVLAAAEAVRKNSQANQAITSIEGIRKSGMPITSIQSLRRGEAPP